MATLTKNDTIVVDTLSELYGARDYLTKLQETGVTAFEDVDGCYCMVAEELDVVERSITYYQQILQLDRGF